MRFLILFLLINLLAVQTWAQWSTSKHTEVVVRAQKTVRSVAPSISNIDIPSNQKPKRTVSAVVGKCGFVPSAADHKMDTRKIKKENLIERAPTVYNEITQLLDQDPERRKITWPMNESLTLQQVSQKIFGTTQRWRELYILNYKNLKTYDHVPLGTQLSVYEFKNPPCYQ